VSQLKATQEGAVIVVDDAGTDDTGKLARAHGALVLRMPLQVGAWGATQTGIRFALQQGSRMVITMDGDGQHLPEAASSLLDTLCRGAADVVIGADIARADMGRRVAWSLFRTLTGLSVSDPTSGFRAYNEKALQVLETPQATLLEYQDIGVLSVLQHAGCRISEIPVQMKSRQHGKSRIFYSWLAIAYYLAYTGVLSFSKRKVGGA
jgi:glycosyltransferase involved in cell wall biosynthesis